MTATDGTTSAAGMTVPAQTPLRSFWRLWAGLSSAELHAIAEASAHQRLAVLDSGADALWLALIDENIDGATHELERPRAAGHGPDPFPPYSRSLADLAARVRREVDIRYPLDVISWRPTRRSANGQCAGPCPLCNDGHDRFVVWPATADRDGRVWCRRCQYTTDVIGLHRALTGDSFPAALEILAAVAGIVMPQPDPATVRDILGTARTARAIQPTPGERIPPRPRPGWPGNDPFPSDAATPHAATPDAATDDAATDDRPEREEER